MCLLYSLSYVSYVRKPPNTDNPNRPYHYKKDLTNFNTIGLTFPTPVKQIPRFESQNPDSSVNVYGLLGKYEQDRKNRVRLYPMYTSPHRNRKHHANLLLLKNETHAHYVVIKSLSRLLYGRTNHQQKSFVCKFCLYSFTKKESCTTHEEVCSQIPAQVVSYPNEHNKYLKFKNFGNGLRTPFTIYCDFESLLVPVHDEMGRKIVKHIPCSVGCPTVSDCQDYNQQQIWTHSGPGTMEKFFEHLDKESARINAIMNDIKPMAPLTVEEKERCQRTKNCGNCGIEFDDDVHSKTFHHDHVSSKFIYATCNRCNLALKHRQVIRKSKRSEAVYEIVVVLHNLSAYDLHLILESLPKSSKTRQVEMSRTIQWTSPHLFIQSFQVHKQL